MSARRTAYNGLFTAEQTVIDNHLADVVTNSWGDTGGDLLDDVATKTAYDDLFLLADSTGMTVQFSSGDDGDNFNLLGFSAADYPASARSSRRSAAPHSRSGSTASRPASSAGRPAAPSSARPTSWAAFPGCTKSTLGTWLPVSFDGGSGGFTSYNYLQPAYQKGVVPVVARAAQLADHRPGSDAGDTRTSRWTQTRRPAS